ncbi:uncharacterized protein IL334_004657 [Kwoniella shivajii]|uniref:Peptidase M20 dimerisation domain-containing protein n=1 Tax=Kwoniella shivajii TaxID=564305 RepID=A0ABZ1D2Q1_9TREE|nr:hypothetical protein IL334_004657 [Kwoniella shivajii]
MSHKAPEPAVLMPSRKASYSRLSRSAAIALVALGVLFTVILPSSGIYRLVTDRLVKGKNGISDKSCEQAEPILPSFEIYNTSTVWDHKDRIIKWHQGAVRIPTQVYDDMDLPEVDERWKIFNKFHQYLEDTYPNVHQQLKRTKVNTYGLVYEWIGSDTSLQPVVLNAHQDVVPVLPDTRNQWSHDPFGAEYDGEYIWGRGSEDDKATLTSIMAAIELLLSTSTFQPRRTVILGFGFDEEIGGPNGAPAISKWLEDKYGPNSMALLIDEGGYIDKVWNQTYGLIATAEKGAFNLNLTVSTLGGHSSVPPKHTGIGILSKLLSDLEDNPFSPTLKKDSPIWGFLKCASSFTTSGSDSTLPEELKGKVRKAIKGDQKSFEQIPELFIKDNLGLQVDSPAGSGMGNHAEALLTTTQAIDVIYGGAKINSLPELVSSSVNYRIDVSSSIDATKSHIYSIIEKRAKTLDLSISGFGKFWSPPNGTSIKGHVYLDSVFGQGLNPAPISPSSIESPAWRILAGTSRGLWASRKAISENGELVTKAEDQLIMTPFMSTGNTDTKAYWNLTRNIYRYEHVMEGDSQGEHTVNERNKADSIIEYTRFFQALILNVDASEDL